MNVLVTGAGGLVGEALCASLARTCEVHGTVRSRPAPRAVLAHRVELSESGAFDHVVERVRPDCVVHAAYSTSDLDRDVVRATAEVAAACARHDVPLIHISTDAVFDGDHGPYAESDNPAPVHPYGRAKLRAEAIVEGAGPSSALVRTSLIAHFDERRPDAATQWILDAQRLGTPVTLFVDEFRTVVRLDDLVAVLTELVRMGPSRRAGYWHVAGPDRLSRWDLGQIVADRYDLDRALLVPGLSSSVGHPRPRDVSLTCNRMLAELSIRPRPVATVPHHGQATG